MSTVKKFVYGFAVFALTVMSLAPAANTANAATLVGGDLIKASGNAVYYYASNGKRYVFPNEKTYRTWYADFSTVKTITDSELAAIQIGGNIVYRPGARLVKITTDPKVYAVSAGGTLHWITSEAIAIALYGTNWAQKVHDVPDAFFTNYTVGSNITGNVHPDGALIKYASSADIYVIEAGQKRKVASESSFNANRFKWDHVNIISDTITYANGTDLTGAETKYTDTAQLGAGGAPGATGGSLTVSLAATTPAAANVPAGTTPATDVPFTAFNFTATGGAVTLTGVYIHRTGLSVDGDLASVKLYQTNMVQLGSSQTFNAEHKAQFSFTKTIAAGATETIMVYADNAANKTGFIQLGIASATDVKSNASAVMGTFPVYGNTMSQVNVSVGTLNVSAGPNHLTTAGTVDIDAANQRFMQVRLTAGAVEDVKLNSITFRKGDAATFNEATDLANIHLVNDKTSTTLGTATFTGSLLVFNLATPILITKGEYVDLSLRGDVVSGATKIITFALIDNGTWLMNAVGASYGFGVNYAPPGSANTVNFGGTLANAETANLTINQGKLQVSKGPNCPATGNIAIGGSDQKIASWKFTAKGEEVKVGSTAITLIPSAGFDVINDATLYKLIDGSGKTWAGPINATGTTLNFTTQMVFPVGDTELFLVAKISSSGLVAGTDNIQAGIQTPASALTNVKGITSNKTVVPTPASNVNGNVMTVQSAALVCGMGSTPIAGTQIIGAIGTHIATLQLNATAGGEDAKLTSVTIRAGNGGLWNNANVNQFSNYKLWDGTTQIGETEEFNTAGGAGTGLILFNIDNGYIVPKNEIKNLKVTADALSLVPEVVPPPPTAPVTVFDCSAATAVGNDSGVTITPTYNTTDSPAQTWKASGQLKVNLDAGNPSAKQIVAGTTGNSVVKYKLEAKWEDIDVTVLNLWAGNGANSAVAASNIGANAAAVKVYKGADSTLLGTTVFGTNGKAVLNIAAGQLRIPKDGSEIVTIKVDLADKAVLTSGSVFWAGFGDSNGDGSEWTGAGNYQMVANGVASGATIAQANIDSVGDGTGNVFGGNEFGCFDGVLTVSLNSASPSGNATTGAGKEVLRLDLTATGSDITVTDLEYIKGGSCDITGTGDAKWLSADGASTYYSWSGATTWLQSSRRWTGGSAGVALTIAAGSTKSVKLTGDTAGCTSDETLQYSIYGSATSSGIIWGDGEATGIDSLLTKNIPVYGGTLKY